MSIEKLTRMRPVAQGFRLNAALPIIPMAVEVSPRELATVEVDTTAPHAHPRGQLIYATSGVMRVICGRDLWVVPPGQPHEVYFPGAVAVLSCG